MKAVLSWLREFAPLPDDVDVVADALNSLGLAVDGVDHVGAEVPGVITAKVLETERHAEAAKVHRVYVDPGTGERLHVWCGAFNMQAGDVVPLATLGTVMPDGREIQRRGILGIESEGMLCSARELGLGDDHSGILILPGDTPLGKPVMEALGIEPDVVFDLDLTRNRPDCWGHLGIARDLAAWFDLPLTVPGAAVAADGPARTATVAIDDPDLCGRFTSTVISGVEVGPSPRWMADRLTRAGMRPINNVVDVSNYVMLELNEPNHAYDLDTLGGGGFRIRRARPGETLVTLDDVERTLTVDDLLICDALDRAIGIAGVMGGADTEIHDGTNVVALEMAWFQPDAIAATSARLGLRSEASARFERGRDPYGIDHAIARFAELLRETSPNLVVHAGAVDGRGDLPPEVRTTQVRIERVNALLGTELPQEEIVALLAPIGYAATPAGDGVLEVSLPSWRPDSTEEVDVTEEVARHHGYERIAKTVPKSVVHGRLSHVQERRRLLHEVLVGCGCSEAMPNPFLAPGDLARAGLDDVAIRISNPLVFEESVLRTSLRPGLLAALGYNESHRRTGVTLYEIGHVYPPGGGVLPDEYEALAVVLAGRSAPDAVRLWREVSHALRFGARLDQSKPQPGYHPTRSAALTQGPKLLGAVGEIHPDVAEAFGISERVACLELDLSVVLADVPPIPKATPVSRFPSSDFDLAFLLADDVPAEKLEKALRQAAGKLLVDLELFDVYRGKGVDEGARSLAYRLRLQAGDRTLTDADVAAVREKCIAAATKLGATLRGA
jgi:phenylalanyl-tRNA synthetase beta chain